MGELIFQVFGALAEFELNLIRERTQAGLSASRARGRKCRRPTGLDDKKRSLTVQFYRKCKHPVADICQMLEISEPTLDRYVREGRYLPAGGFSQLLQFPQRINTDSEILTIPIVLKRGAGQFARCPPTGRRSLAG